MKIVIIGDGKVGYSLAEGLSQEDNDVTIIDKNSQALQKASDNLDVMCIKGNGVSAKVLQEAGVQDADLLIAATSSDEMNMVCCLTGKKLGAQHTIARIRDPEYSDELSAIKRDLGLDMVINPEQAAAAEIARQLRFSSSANVEVFARGRVELVEIRVSPEMILDNMILSHMHSHFSMGVLVGAVERDGEVFIPNGETVLKAGDIIYVVGRPSSITEFCKKLGLNTQRVRDVMVVGGGRVGYYLGRYLQETGIKSKIIEIDPKRCNDLAELLPHSLVICGDGSDDGFLRSENLGDMDGFVAVTGRDEENLLTALIAKQMGVKKVVAKINRINYTYATLMESLGVDSVVAPKQIITNSILRYVRGLKNAMGNKVETLYKIVGGRAEALEFLAGPSTSFLNVPFKDLKLIPGVLVAAIVRRADVIIPHGRDFVQEGDSVIIITTQEQLNDLNDIIAPGGLRR